jgi:hypothetical protein
MVTVVAATSAARIEPLRAQVVEAGGAERIIAAPAALAHERTQAGAADGAGRALSGAHDQRSQ